MNTYNPDNWVIIHVDGNTPHYRVLCGWHGGYLHGDSWKLSSGIEGLEDCGTYWKLPQTSGSVYHLRKGGEHISGITAGVLATLETKNCTRVDFNTFVKDFNNRELAI